MSDDQGSRRDSSASSVEEAAEEGPLPEDMTQDESSSTREDFQQREGVIPESDNDLDPDRDLSPEERQRAIAEDETVGGIFQPGGRGG